MLNVLKIAVVTVAATDQGSHEIPGWVIKFAIVGAVAIGLGINQLRQGRKNTDLWVTLEPVLQKGPATLPALTTAAGLSGIMGRGKVVMALQDKIAQGRVEVTEAPDGTPQLEKVNVITYRLKGI